MNKLIFIGTVVREPRFSEKNKPILGFTLKSERKVADKTFSSYLECLFVGDKAKKLNGTVSEHDLVIVDGEVGCETYTARDNTPKAKLKMFPFSIDLPLKSASIPSDGASPAPAATTNETTDVPVVDDVPF